MRMWDFRIHADSRRGQHARPELDGKAACLVVALHPLRPERLFLRSLPTNFTIRRTNMMSPEKEFDAMDMDLQQLKQRILCWSTCSGVTGRLDAPGICWS